ncbi:glutamic protease [Pholiota conissans]|uniref:Glutamic protease n=1 Tax=Pholiota conissans TaxID=109636 RepID=A0A9P5YXL6_9AGAR|nr:glutamic protease [Pholiota conissans]
MKFSAVVLAAVFLFTDVAFARPSRLQERIAARARSSRTLIRADPNTVLQASESRTNTSHVEFSSNWSGAVLETPPSGQTFTTVTGTFKVPTPSGTGAASAWVGIDGDTAQNSILQSGVDFTVSGGRVSYQAWFEWFPNFAIDFNNFPISSGQTITVTVHATSKTAGTVVMTNVSTGKTITQAVSAPSSSAALAGQNAEWIVEDFEEGGSLVTLTNFGSVTFTGATASTASQSVGVTGATIIDMQQNGNTLTSVSTTSSSVTVNHL